MLASPSILVQWPADNHCQNIVETSEEQRKTTQQVRKWANNVVQEDIWMSQQFFYNVP